MLIDNDFRKKIIPGGNVEEEILILEPLTAPEFLSPLSSHRKGNPFYSHPANIDFFLFCKGLIFHLVTCLPTFFFQFLTE